VMNFFSKLFQGWKKIQARAEAIKKTAAGTTSVKDSAVKVKYISAMAFKGLTTPAAILEGGEALADLSEEHMTTYGDMSQAYSELTLGILTDAKSGAGYTKTLFGKFRAAHLALIKSHAKYNDIPGSNTITTLTDAQLMATDGAAEAMEAVGIVNTAISMLPKIGKSTTYRKVDEAQAITRMPAADIVKLMDATIKIAKTLSEMKVAREKSSAERKSAIAAADVIISASDKNIFQRGWNKGKIRIMTRMLSKDINKSSNQLNKIAFSACRGYVSLAESTLSSK